MSIQNQLRFNKFNNSAINNDYKKAPYHDQFDTVKMYPSSAIMYKSFSVDRDNFV
jgi:hypothetical protein